jgi:hypothetical protein
LIFSLEKVPNYSKVPFFIPPEALVLPSQSFKIVS